EPSAHRRWLLESDLRGDRIFSGTSLQSPAERDFHEGSTGLAEPQELQQLGQGHPDPMGCPRGLRPSEKGWPGLCGLSIGCCKRPWWRPAQVCQ
ncbi:unnamed protein product, partial [Symbiodinium sp. KB8]